jgi:hypothetical protein
MNVAMNVTGQHEFHPDAESLSAFAEQALGERERSQVLEHLAVCGRCRQVVALAREAADAEASARAARQVVNQPNDWWKRWRLVWAPTAVAAALAVTSISVFVRQAEQHEASIKIAERTAPPRAGPASVPPPTEHAAHAPAQTAAIKPAPVASEAEKAKSARSGEAPGERGREPAAAAAMPEAGAMDRTEMVREAETRREEAASASRAEERAPAGESIPGPVTTAFFSQEQSATPLPRERSRQAEAAPSRLPAGSATQTVTVQAEDKALAPSATPAPATANATLEVKVEPGANLPLEKKSIAGGLFAARMATPIHLPSGRPTVSIASAGPRMLAIDQAGTLYLSEDSGATWEPVIKQWTGRAVAVHRQAAESGNPATVPADEAEHSGNTAGASTAPRPVAIFEILNDQSHVWVSADGRVWTAK